MDQMIQTLVGQGVGGCVLAWLMFRMETILKDLSRAVWLNNRSILLLVLVNDGLNKAGQAEAESLMEETKSALIKGGKP